MNKWSLVAALVLLVLASAMGLRNLVNARHAGSSPTLVAMIGSAPVPPSPQ